MAQLDYVEGFVRGVHRSMTSGVSAKLTGPWFSRKDQGSLFLDEGDATAYARVVARLVEEQGKKEDVSRRTLETHLQDVLFSALDLKADSKDDAEFEKRLVVAMAQFRGRLKQPPTDYTCYIPVFGLDVEGLPSNMGGVRLVRMTAPRMRQLAFPGDVELPDESAGNRQRLLGTLKEDLLLGRPMAMVKVRARDADAAQYLANRKTRETVDVLNFFADLIPNSPGWLYLAGEAAKEAITSTLVRPDGFLALHSSLEGPFAPMSMKRLRSTPSLRPGLQRVKQLLSEDPRSYMAELLVTSARWAGRASTEPVREQAFLDYAIALETLMLPDQETEGLTYRLKLRTAHFLAQSLEDRERLSKAIGSLYRTRSRIVHSGSLEVADRDLRHLRFLTKNCIIRALLHRRIRHLDNRDAYVSWLNRAVLR